MVRKALLTLVALLLLSGVFAVFWILTSEEETGDGAKSVPKKAAAEEVWDGRGEHVYNMQFPDRDGGSLVIERVSFSGLRSPRATAVVRLVYLGSKVPQWLRPGSISAFYSNSDDDISSSLSIGPLDDGRAVIDLVLRRVPSVRLDPETLKGVFMKVQGLLPRQEPLLVRITASPEPGYMLGSK